MIKNETKPQRTNFLGVKKNANVLKFISVCIINEEEGGWHILKP